MNDRLLIRIPEAAEMLSISRATAYKLVAEGKLPSVTLGFSKRIPLAGLKAWIEERERVPFDETPWALTIRAN